MFLPVFCHRLRCTLQCLIVILHLVFFVYQFSGDFGSVSMCGFFVFILRLFLFRTARLRIKTKRLENSQISNNNQFLANYVIRYYYTYRR